MVVTFCVLFEVDEWLVLRGSSIVARADTAKEALSLAAVAAALVPPSEVFLRHLDGTIAVIESIG